MEKKLEEIAKRDKESVEEYFEFVKDEVQNGNFFVTAKNSEIHCGILRKDVHVEMEIYLKKFVKSENLSWEKIETLTALIWLNMAPLHHHPFDKFLYFYGRYNLKRALDV